MIGLIGYGYVGKAVYDLLITKYEVVIKEIDDTYDEVNDNCDVNVICVPTPMKSDGSVDISIVEEAVDNLFCDLIIIKSTIPPTTTEYLKEKYKKNIVFSPEYIGEGNYPIPYWDGYPHSTDMTKHEFTILGGSKRDTSIAVDALKLCFGPFHKYIQTDSLTAEVTKYMENSWIATKVTFCNEFYQIADTFGIDYNELREVWLNDKRVTRSHTLVSSEGGFSGKCIPKDLNGIIKAVENAGYKPEFLKEILSSNERYKNA